MHMLNKLFLTLVLFVSSCGYAQTPMADTDKHDVAPATALSNDELLARDKTIFVTTDSYFVKKEQLEQGLVGRKDLGAWGIHVVNSAADADLILKVERLPFRSRFTFTFTDHASGIVVLGGTVNSAFGTVAGKIAGDLADRLKQIHKH